MSVGRNQQPVKRGQPLTAKRLSNIGKDAQRSVQTPGANNRRFHDGVTVDYPQLKGNAPAGLVVRWAKVVDVFNDCLSCVFIQTVTPLNVQTITIDGTAISDPFYVAKPWALQVSPFDGQTITYIDGEEITYTKDATDPEFKRNHSDGVDNADFVITPNYYVGEWITIARLPSPIVLPGGSSYTVLDWIDLGLNKVWCTEPELQGVGGGGGTDIKSADTKANLTTLMTTDGMIGYTTGATKRFYVKINSEMVCISHLE